ncbi:MAG TPA: DUF4097 family beta strand repeat-containing protein [Chloroflexota bacterium]
MTPVVVPAAVSNAPTTAILPPSFDAEPPPSTNRRGVLAGSLLVAIGLSALFAAWLPGGGAWLFVGLGSAFMLARVLTGHRGYAVPAGILLGFGTFVLLTETGWVIGPASGGLFFVCLGLGFLTIYAIAARPEAVWPILPGLLLIGFGTFVLASTFGPPFTNVSWLAQFWPLTLVAVGVWLLLRDRLPANMRTPVVIVGSGVLILGGILVAAAAVAGAGVPYARMPWPMVRVPFGNPPVQDVITLTAPVDGVSSIRLVNTSGTTLVRSSSAPAAAVQATRHFWDTGQAPDIRLVPVGGALVVETSAVGPNSAGAYIDYVVEVPANLGADVRSASGSVAVSGLQGPVQIASASGGVDIHDLSGATSLSTTSGAIRMDNVAGELRVGTTSGGTSGTALSRLVSARSSSGDISLNGDFTSGAQIASTSGGVTLGFAPAASIHIDAASLSGDVRATGLELTNQSMAPHGLSGDLGSGGPTVSVRTTSGSIRLHGSS